MIISTSVQSTYEESDLRVFLNNNFYNKAFLFEENKPIEIEVDNSSHNTSLIEEITKNTFDKVYVPSYQEIMSQP